MMVRAGTKQLCVFEYVHKSAWLDKCNSTWEMVNPGYAEGHPRKQEEATGTPNLRDFMLSS